MFRARATMTGCVVLAAILTAGARPAQGHHSFAMFDTGRQVTLSGVVTGLRVDQSSRVHRAGRAGRRWRHEALDDRAGQHQHPQRGGWKFNTLKKGDKVTAVVNPLRNGEPGSLLSRITLPDGRVLGNGGPAGVATGRGAAPAARPAEP